MKQHIFGKIDVDETYHSEAGLKAVPVAPFFQSWCNTTYEYLLLLCGEISSFKNRPCVGVLNAYSIV